MATVATYAEEIIKATEAIIEKAADGDHLSADDWKILLSAGIDKPELESRVKFLRRVQNLQELAGTAKQREDWQAAHQKAEATLKTEGDRITQQIQDLNAKLRELQRNVRDSQRKVEQAEQSASQLRETRAEKTLLPESVLLEYNARKRQLYSDQDFAEFRKAPGKIERLKLVENARYGDGFESEVVRLADGAPKGHPVRPRLKQSGKSSAAVADHVDAAAWLQYVEECREERQRLEQWLEDVREDMETREAEVESIRNHWIK
ncbi:hypothetical protein GYB59_14420 [bacterium]|nr:hypothetical protein [bacterium]